MRLTLMVRRARPLLLVACAATEVGQYRPISTGFGRVLFPGGTAPNPAAISPVTGNISATPFGRVLYPGTGAPVAIRPGTTSAGSGGAFLNPMPQVQHQNHSTPILIPYPVYYTGGFYNYHAPSAQMATNASLVSYGSSYQTSYPYGTPNMQFAPATNMDAQPSPVVIINQYFRPDSAPTSAAPEPEMKPAPAQQVSSVARPATEVAAEPARTQPDSPMFLIAMKDHTIFAASAYWIEDGTLNYVTIQGSSNSASMELVDRELSRRLNRDRNVAFGLPEN